MKLNTLLITPIIICTLNTVHATSIEKTASFYVSDISYEEPGVMSDNGAMLGIKGSYGIYDQYMLKFEASYAEGIMSYESNGTGSDTGVYDYIYELRQLAGKTMSLENGTLITPYIGFGYRYLNDDSSNHITSSGAMGYEREQSYFYSPIGFETRNHQLKNGWFMGGNIEYDVFWEGINHSHAGNIPGFYNHTFNQFKGYGYRFSFNFSRHDNLQTYIVEPFYKHWSIDESDIAIDAGGNGYVEPENTSDELGISFIWLI